METPQVELQHLKRVSRIKHEILTKYLPSWAIILGSKFDLMYYVDCFAGPGHYETEGVVVDGSPIIAVKAGKAFAEKNQNKRLGVVLVDDDRAQLEKLRECLKSTLPYPQNFRVDTRLADSHNHIPRVISGIKARNSAPSFFLVDPYGHPLSIPTMNEVLRLPHSELLINLMWFRINMNMSNPAVAHHVTALFGDEGWMRQPFVQQKGPEREKGFLEYFRGRLSAKYVLPFRIRFDAHEDRNAGERTKYYLIHASNNLKAVYLMKDVMWPLGDEEGTFDFSGDSQGVLISQTPQLDELRAILLREFAGREVAFDDIHGKTWPLPFIEKHYRSVLQELRSSGVVVVTPVSSKGKGLSGRDLVRFPKEQA
jgi:three-Cys-motif partner protein